jgi:hypothetical protein
MTNAEAATLLPRLGPQANEGDVVYLMEVRQHEQLGHAIAYARSVGLVPQWTAAALGIKRPRKMEMSLWPLPFSVSTP